MSSHWLPNRFSFNIFFFIHFTSISQAPPSSPPRPIPTNPSPHYPFPLSSEKEKAPSGAPGISSLSRTKLDLFHWDLTRQSSRGRGFSGGQQSQRQSLCQLLGDQHDDQAAHLLQMCRGSRFSPARPFDYLIVYHINILSWVLNAYCWCIWGRVKHIVPGHTA